LAPSAAVGVLLLLFLARTPDRITGPSQPPPVAAAGPVLKVDHLLIDQRLIASFDAVARLPGGAPIRFHCRAWQDEVIMRDAAQNVVIERRTPRLEVIPVAYEIY
jgi:hypothetical protein